MFPRTLLISLLAAGLTGCGTFAKAQRAVLPSLPSAEQRLTVNSSQDRSLASNVAPTGNVTSTRSTADRGDHQGEPPHHTDLAVAPASLQVDEPSVLPQPNEDTTTTPEPIGPPAVDALEGPAKALPPWMPNPFHPVPFDSTLPPALHPDESNNSSVQPLELSKVVESVYLAYPGLEAAMREIDIAEGREVQSWGNYDFKIKAESISQPLGFYENYRNAVKLEQAFSKGGGIYGQYRIGDGDFPVWYGERETNEGGEFKLGLLQPLLRGRAIDEDRVEVMQATLMRQRAEPYVQRMLLEFVFAASDSYWSWVAAGQSYGVQRDLLRVTIDRNRIYEGRVKAGDLPQIELVQNQRLIAARETKMAEAKRKLQASAIKLSLYLRDATGQPLIPSDDMLPLQFPDPQPIDLAKQGDAVQLAFELRPELRELNIERKQAEVSLALGQNQLLPALNATLDASKDVGAEASSKGDKTPFELEAGLFFDVPLQRRKAEGKIREAYGKLAQLAAKRRLAENKITVEVQDAFSALSTAYERWQRARESTALANQLEQAERERFLAQDSDLLRVALQETSAIEAALIEIEALADYFRAMAAYRASTGQDPSLMFTDPEVRKDQP